VKRGSMLRQVRGLGSLIPSHEDVRQISAETEATVIRIDKLPGSQVTADTVLVEMVNPQLEAGGAGRAVAGESRRGRVPEPEGEAERSDGPACGAATVNADYNEAQRQAQTDSRSTIWALSPAWRRRPLPERRRS